MGKRDLRINFQKLLDMAREFNDYLYRIDEMQAALNKFDNSLEGYSGDAITALRENKKAVDKFISAYREQIVAIRDLIQDYVTRMTDYIWPTNWNMIVRVDRDDIKANLNAIEDYIDVKKSMKMHDSIYMSNASSTTQDSSYKFPLNDEQYREVQSKADANNRSGADIAAALNSLDKRLKMNFDALMSEYKNKVIPYENTDDEYTAYAKKKLYDKYATATDRYVDFISPGFEFVGGVAVSIVTLGVEFVKMGVGIVKFAVAGYAIGIGNITGADKPKWALDTIESFLGILKGLKKLLSEPISIFELIAQSVSDTVDSKGAYGIGEVTGEVLGIFIGTKGLSSVGKGAKAVVKSVDDIVDTAKGVTVVDIGTLNAKTVRTYTAKEVNQWFKDNTGYSNSPYKPNTDVIEIKLLKDEKFVRVYNKDKSGLKGQWIMREDDIKGLTPKQIQEKYALPVEPKYIGEVKIKEGTIIRAGIANENYGYVGEGVQFDLIGQRPGTYTEIGSLENWSLGK